MTQIYPHCDNRVLHSPGTCVYCDKSPKLQALRLLGGVNFTDTNDPTKLPCPAVEARGLESINSWGGNVATTKQMIKDNEEAWSELFSHSMHDGDPNRDCPKPPKGWHCTRGYGHGGSCAAHPTGINRLIQWLKHQIAPW